MIGNPDRRLNAREIEALCDSGSIVHAKPRRSVGRIVRLYWLQALAFVAFLFVLFVFVATGHVGN